jgi:uncharacterized membrane protein
MLDAIAHHARAEARLIAAIIGGIGAWLMLAMFPISTRLLLAWNVAAWLYVGLALRTMAATAIGDIRQRSELEEEGRSAALVFSVGAAVAAMVAIGIELAGAKETQGVERALRTVLGVVTIIGSWLLVHFSFALYYAHEFHSESGGRTAGASGGLEFPGERAPNYWDFLYFSLVVGTTMQTPDVEIVSRPMRRRVTVHSLIAFVFNTAVIALAVNMVAQ